MIRRLRAVAPLALVAALLAGCASSPAGSGSSPAPAPSEDATAYVEPETVAGWLVPGSLAVVVTRGSSSCVPSVTEATADGSHLSAVLSDPENVACTMDYAPRASLVGVPEGLDVSSRVSLTVSYGENVSRFTLPAVSERPSGEPGPAAAKLSSSLVAVLSYGSSSCRPAVSDVQATSPEQLSVVLQEPKDTPCTMDYAPRVNLAGFSPAELEKATSLTITLGESRSTVELVDARG